MLFRMFLRGTRRVVRTIVAVFVIVAFGALIVDTVRVATK